MSEILAAMQPWVTFFTKAILINRNPAGNLPEAERELFLQDPVCQCLFRL